MRDTAASTPQVKACQMLISQIPSQTPVVFGRGETSLKANAACRTGVVKFIVVIARSGAGDYIRDRWTRPMAEPWLAFPGESSGNGGVKGAILHPTQ